jgi:hypothetical protein
MFEASGFCYQLIGKFNSQRGVSFPGVIGHRVSLISFLVGSSQSLSYKLVVSIEWDDAWSMANLRLKLSFKKCLYILIYCYWPAPTSRSHPKRWTTSLSLLWISDEIAGLMFSSCSYSILQYIICSHKFRCPRDARSRGNLLRCLYSKRVPLAPWCARCPRRSSPCSARGVCPFLCPWSDFP